MQRAGGCTGQAGAGAGAGAAPQRGGRVRERRHRMGGHGGQVGEIHYALTLRRLPIAVKLTRPHPTRHYADVPRNLHPADVPVGPRVRRQAGDANGGRGGCGGRAEAAGWCIVASLDEHPVRTIRTLV